MTIPTAKEYLTPLAGVVLNDYCQMDGAGVVYGAFQVDEGPPNHVKHCEVRKRVGMGTTEHWEPVCACLSIYAPGKIFINLAGEGIVYGLTEDKQHEARALIPGWVART
jgi:hypothetical protein